MKLFIAVFFMAAVAFGRTKPTDQPAMPSKEEISDLLKKADEKVSGFEKAVKNAKPYLDKIDPKFATTYLDASSDAHTIIAGMQTNGISAYGLVSLLATLDDLSLNAANASVQLLLAAKSTPADAGALSATIPLASASTACNDISELIMHATLRYVHVEEELLGKLMASQK